MLYPIILELINNSVWYYMQIIFIDINYRWANVCLIAQWPRKIAFLKKIQQSEKQKVINKTNERSLLGIM